VLVLKFQLTPSGLYAPVVTALAHTGGGASKPPRAKNPRVAVGPAANRAGEGMPSRAKKPRAQQKVPAFRSLTRGNFSHNLRVLTGRSPKNAHAHHVLPQEFAEKFHKAGIIIHDPRYGAWWDAAVHQRSHAVYNVKWKSYFDEFRIRGKSPSAEEILQFGRDIARSYGLTTNF
jgi:hypothetical protein